MATFSLLAASCDKNTEDGSDAPRIGSQLEIPNILYSTVSALKDKRCLEATDFG
jgi:hypothetical protein